MEKGCKLGARWHASKSDMHARQQVSMLTANRLAERAEKGGPKTTGRKDREER
jgi:hypothetical protein